MALVKKGVVKKMAESERKKAKGAISAKKTKKTVGGKTKAAECVSCLLDLHSLQGVLLKQLDKEIS